MAAEDYEEVVSGGGLKLKGADQGKKKKWVVNIDLLVSKGVQQWEDVWPFNSCVFVWLGRKKNHPFLRRCWRKRKETTRN
jgi:hypothetical protein